ncbi:MAG TPA: 4a-hydroxytetrahydrobiopterin dehydratase [Chitinophagales bacterium]|jgi:4a-hydroxytetrahydrobiopterin dehydratase|nr:4a-hydroxytetrahydrobiopterin dehydratase [Chitinophagales bacterium]MBP6153181.1 4a-hydroxytetrahydrobiopterin dehydratase [Chitinophagales bacterium]HQV78917.1 4a-hydroxytetrahydrobiopterin dehydratase [Chitinophagales bacterium]HQW79283.1 4a-hydroxytetrahydrobiopterin dehydratase [Chitinophagales bacterium]HRB66643.1 4a-hydroxytetrahydrobiopterin dehydratase [Chitinophagales bacterium]
MSWITKDNKLTKCFVFKDFIEAFSFITQVALLAEKQNHHPEIYNVYNKVILSLQTHDADNSITEKDILLSKSIDELKI